MATERSSRNTGSSNRTGRTGSTNRGGSTNRNGRRRVSKAELKRRQRKKWIILGIEFFVVFILIIALFFITKLDAIHKDYIDEDEIQTNETVNSEEMLEEFLISEEDVKFNNMRIIGKILISIVWIIPITICITIITLLYWFALLIITIMKSLFYKK